MGISRAIRCWGGPLRTYRDLLGRHGLRSAIGSIADRVAAKAFAFCASHLYCFELAGEIPAPRTPANLTCRFLTPSEIRYFAPDPANELDVRMANRAETGTDLCFGILAGDRLAGYGWCALDSIEPEHTGGIALSFPPHIGYMYKGFTHPDFRGQGLNGIRVVLAGQALRERGIRQLVCLVDWANWASIQSCRRIGGQDLGLTITFRIAGRRFWFFPDAARQLGLCFGDQTPSRTTRRLSDLQPRGGESSLCA